MQLEHVYTLTYSLPFSHLFTLLTGSFTVPLTTLPFSTPPKNSESHSMPAPIKPRGAAQRSSIAKLLATKKNNVANLISQIETKETSQNMPNLQSYVPSELGTKQERENKGCTFMHMTNLGVKSNEKTTSNSHFLQLSGFVPPTKLPTCTCGTIPFPISTTPPHHCIKPHSPHVHPDPRSLSLSSSHTQSLPLPQSHPPFNSSSTPHSYVQPTTHIQTHAHINTSHISHSSTSTTSNVHSRSHVDTPPLLHSLASLSGGSQEDAPSNGSPIRSESSIKRCRPVNEVVYKCKNSPHGDSDSSTESPHVSEIAEVNPREIFNKMPPASPGIASDANSQRRHPISPKGENVYINLYNTHVVYMYTFIYVCITNL